MNCREVQEAILDGLEFAHDHLAGCEYCRAFAEEQQRVDSALRLAFRPPDLSPAFRQSLKIKIHQEKQRARWESLAVVGAPCTAVLTSAICAVSLPAYSYLFLALGACLAILSYGASFVFEWLAEELGER